MNETPKQKAIREAWGKAYEHLKEHIDQSGWCSVSSETVCAIVDFPLEWKEMHIIFGHPEHWTRPVSIKEIDNNNSWLSIKEHGLPKEDGIYWIFDKEIGVDFEKFVKSDSGRVDLWSKFIKYYQPVVKPLPPIY